MSDLFHKDVPAEFIAKVFAVMALAPQHQFQVLTKRHGRMRSLLNNYGWWTSVVMHALELGDNPSPTQTLPDGRCALSNVWLGVSVEDQHAADLRIPALLETPAAVRFLSMEPLLGPVSFRWAPWVNLGTKPGERTGHLDGLNGIDWVIVGGESGRGARPMHPQWARDLRDQCAAAEVPYFFKQWGEWAPAGRKDPRYTGSVKGGYWRHEGGWGQFTLDRPGDPAWMLRVGTKAAGNALDGATIEQFPTTQEAPA